MANGLMRPSAHVFAVCLVCCYQLDIQILDSVLFWCFDWFAARSSSQNLQLINSSEQPPQ